MTQLTKHFTLEELTHSQTAAREGIDNHAPPEIFRNLVLLCDELLEQIRKAVSRPIVISSGYRCPALNVAVKGSKNSDHLRGLAADITAPGMALDELAECVRLLAPYVPLKQCIREFGQWIHVSCVPAEDMYDADFAPEFLIAERDENGRTVYTRWLA